MAAADAKDDGLAGLLVHVLHLRQRRLEADEPRSSRRRRCRAVSSASPSSPCGSRARAGRDVVERLHARWEQPRAGRAEARRRARSGVRRSFALLLNICFFMRDGLRINATLAQDVLHGRAAVRRAHLAAPDRWQPAQYLKLFSNKMSTMRYSRVLSSRIPSRRPALKTRLVAASASEVRSGSSDARTNHHRLHRGRTLRPRETTVAVSARPRSGAVVVVVGRGAVVVREAIAESSRRTENGSSREDGGPRRPRDRVRDGVRGTSRPPGALRSRQGLAREDDTLAS